MKVVVDSGGSKMEIIEGDNLRNEFVGFEEQVNKKFVGLEADIQKLREDNINLLNMIYDYDTEKKLASTLEEKAAVEDKKKGLLIIEFKCPKCGAECETDKTVFDRNNLSMDMGEVVGECECGFFMDFALRDTQDEVKSNKKEGEPDEKES